MPFFRVAVTALRSDQFPPHLRMFRNYPAPHERMEQLIGELMESRVASSKKFSSQAIPSPASSHHRRLISENPMTSEVPYNRMLTSFLQELFGETIKEAQKPEDVDLQESVIALLSSFSRRYVSSSKLFDKQVPASKQVGSCARKRNAVLYHETRKSSAHNVV